MSSVDRLLVVEQRSGLGGDASVTELLPSSCVRIEVVG
jgi:hypothetical protein